MKDAFYDDRMLGKSHTARLVQGETDKDHKELELKVFKERMRLNSQGQHGDVVRGC